MQKLTILKINNQSSSCAKNIILRLSGNLPRTKLGCKALPKPIFLMIFIALYSLSFSVFTCVFIYVFASLSFFFSFYLGWVVAILWLLSWLAMLWIDHQKHAFLEQSRVKSNIHEFTLYIYIYIYEWNNCIHKICFLISLRVRIIISLVCYTLKVAMSSYYLLPAN